MMPYVTARLHFRPRLVCFMLVSVRPSFSGYRHLEFRLASSQLPLSSSRARWDLWPSPLYGGHHPPPPAGPGLTAQRSVAALQTDPWKTLHRIHRGIQSVLSKSTNSHGVLQHSWEGLAPIPCSAWESNEQRGNARMKWLQMNEEKAEKTTTVTGSF